MKKEKLGQFPAFAIEYHKVTKEGNKRVRRTILYPGMSKRFYAACCAMQGMLADLPKGISKIEIAESAFAFADELLKQEDK